MSEWNGIKELELVLGLAMYALDLSDFNAHSDEFPPGVQTNSGELSYAAESLIRATWAKYSPAEQIALLKRAYQAALNNVQK